MNTTIDFQVNRPLFVLVTLLGLTLLFNSTGHAADVGRVAGDLQVEGLWFTGDSNKTVIRKPTDFPAPWTISGTDIYYSRGNVGIGTPSPTALLDVNGTAKATDFVGTSIGTSDNSPFEIKVNNSRVLRIEPTADGPNIAAGFSGNVAGGVGIYGATVSGGGNGSYSALINTASGTYSTVGGGAGNSASGLSSTVSGGDLNKASGERSTIIGGSNNKASGNYATVGGGDSNQAIGNHNSVGGGLNNTASSNYSSTVGGGEGNMANGAYSTVVGGNFNSAIGLSSTVGGGASNTAGGNYSFAGGNRAKVRSGADIGNMTGDQGTFLWADSKSFDFDSTTSNEFAVRATGGFRFVTAINGSTGAPTKTTSIDSNGNLVVAGSVSVGNTTPVSEFSVTSGNYDVDDLWSGSGTVNGFEVGGSGTDRYVAIKRDGGNSALNISKGSTGTSGLITFFVKGTAVGSVTTSGTTTAFNTTSDARLKKNISPTSFTVDDLMNLQVRDYSYIADTASTPQTGFIAQELHEVIPQAVSVGGDDPSVNPWQVDYGKLTPFLVKAVQDLKHSNDRLEADNDVMKTRLERLEKMLGIAELKPRNR